MVYRNLGRTGVKVSPITLGCLMFGWKTNEADSFVLTERALEAGVNMLDTANVYGRGRSEEVVGAVLKRLGQRDRIVLATKVYRPMADDDPNAGGLSRRHIIDQCEQSLRRLQTDYIDLYQVHRPQPDVAIDETLRALDDLIQAGKVRYIGTSTFAAWQFVESLWASKEYGLNRFVSEQPPYNLLDRRIERELVPMAQTYGIALLPWSPLAGGFLTGKYRKQDRRPVGSRFERPDPWEDRHFTEQAFGVVDVLDAIARERSVSTSQVALAWCCDRPGITSTIIGPRTLEQLEDNLGALSIHLTEDEHSRLDQASPPGRSIVSYYEAEFGPHVYRW